MDNSNLPNLHALFGNIAASTLEPKLISKVDPDNHNIEYLVSSDLAPNVSLSASPEERARQFLLDKTGVTTFGLSANRLENFLFLKHAMCSRMGTHCLFGLRSPDGTEVHDTLFGVHLDQSNRIVMVTSTYDPKSLGKFRFAGTPPVGQYYKLLEEQLKKANGPDQPSGKVNFQPVWINSAEGYQPGLQIKYKTKSNRDRVLVLLVNGLMLAQDYVYAAANAPTFLGTANIYADLWSPPTDGSTTLKIEEVWERQKEKIKPVVLRDLESRDDLRGHYAAVQDGIYSLWFAANGKFDFSDETSESKFDRVMAYYHLDRVQRYFRELGLEVLDECAQFKPMWVILDPPPADPNIGSATRYSPHEQRIHLKTVYDQTTDAREPRIIYHEFVHAVTDALARLPRTNTLQSDKPRFKQMVQAAAMDEGLADYFACSLAARENVLPAHFYPLEIVGNDNAQLTLEHTRKLGPDVSNAYPYDEKVFSRKPSMEAVYLWGEQWGRFLWTLRCQLGPEAADTIIAHSIFFLTRWATFGLGIQSVIVSDRLLFDGMHEDKILAVCQPFKKFDPWDERKPGGD